MAQRGAFGRRGAANQVLSDAPPGTITRLNRRIDIALSDEVLSEAEVERVLDEALAMKVGEQEVRAILDQKVRTVASRRMQPIIEEIQASRRFSPQHEEKMRTVARDLRLPFDFDLAALEPFRTLWCVENGEEVRLVPIQADIFLRPGERCYFAGSSTWCQVRTVRESRGSVAGGVSLRAAKDVRVPTGRAVPVSSIEERLQPISLGRIYLTNQRVVFVGIKKSAETWLGNIASYGAYADGVELFKSTGSPDIYRMTETDAGVFHARLGAALIRQR